MKLVSESIRDYLKPKSKEQILKDIELLSQERRDEELIKQSGKGNKEVVEMLLDAGADPSVQDELGNTASVLASENGHKEVVEMLLNVGVDPNVQDKYGETALMLALANGHKEIVNLLKKYGAKNKV